MTEDFAKSHRMREKIHQAADNITARHNATQPHAISVENPWINGTTKQINAFDVFDGLQRMLIIIEPTTPVESDAPSYSMHLIKWNCNPIQAHSIAIEAVYETRKTEQDSIAEAIRKGDVIPEDYAVEPNGSHERNG